MAVILQFPGAINHFTIEKLAREVVEFCANKEKEKVKKEEKKA